MDENEIIRRILEETKTIAVVGLSPKPYRPSHQVSSYLKSVGYKIIPVYPDDSQKILGERVYKTVQEIEEDFDTLLIFLRPERVYEVVKSAIERGVKYIWLQEGVINYKAKELAEKHSKLFVMDRCMYKEHSRLYKGG